MLTRFQKHVNPVLCLILVMGIIQGIGRMLVSRQIPTVAPLILDFWSQDRIYTDWDGDHQRDLVIGNYSLGTYQVEINFSQPKKDLIFTVPCVDPSSNLISVDVDHDQDLDLVITSAFTPQPIQVWLSDGQGNFVSDLHPQSTTLQCGGSSLPILQLQHPVIGVTSVNSVSYVDGVLSDSCFGIHPTTFSQVFSTCPDSCRSIWLTLLRGRAPPSLR